MNPRGTTSARGLGWDHQQARAALLAAHVDGDPCPCLDLNDCGSGCPCRAAGHGLPMYRDPARNVDGQVLQADHSYARIAGGYLPDRLLLARCNASRGARLGNALRHGERAAVPLRPTSGGRRLVRPDILITSRDW